VIPTILRAFAGHWWRNPLQLFTVLAGLALATALWSGVQAINTEARASYDSAARTLDRGRFDRIDDPSGAPIPFQTFVSLRRAGWLVSPIVEAELAGITVLGLDPLTAPPGLAPQTGDDGGDGPAFLPDRGVIFGDAASVAAVAGALDPAPETVVTPEAAPGIVLTDIRLAQRIMGRGDVAGRLIVLPDQPLGRPPLDQVAPGLRLTQAGSQTDVAQLTDSFHLNLTAFGFLSFAVGLFIVNGAIGLTFEQRRGMVRTMRALGVPLGRLVAALAVELVSIAVLAGAIGVALGYLIAAALLPDVAATLRGLYGAEVAGGVSLRAEWWLSGLGIAIAGTAAASCAAIWRIARMPILASARPRAWSMASGPGRRLQWLSGLVLLMASGALALWGEGLAAGFALLAALLIGAALILPAIIDLVLAIGLGRAEPGLRQWFWADTRQQVPGLSLALMALLLAMSANVGVSTMVSSFRLTFVGFLDQRLASELYVRTDSPAEARAFVDFAGPRAGAILPLMSVEGTVAGLPSEIFGARDDATYRENWALLSRTPSAWDDLARGAGVLVNEQLARRAGLALGDRIDVGGAQDLPVLGVYGDYGNPIGQVILGEALFRDLWPEVEPLNFGIRLPPEEVPGFVAAAREDLGLPEQAFVDQASIKALSLRVFDRTFTVTGALNVLTLAVAGFAILMSLLTLAALRIPQLAPVWALGVGRRVIGRIELGRAVLLAALTTLAALPLGLALAWALLAVVNVEAFGWRLPMYLFPLDYLRLGGLALLASVLAALWPARRLSRTPPAELLKVFSNER